MNKLKIKRANGSFYEALPIISFNNNYSHFIVDDGCYLLVNGHFAPKESKVGRWIFPEAVEVLRKLPSNPKKP